MLLQNLHMLWYNSVQEPNIAMLFVLIHAIRATARRIVLEGPKYMAEKRLCQFYPTGS